MQNPLFQSISSAQTLLENLKKKITPLALLFTLKGNPSHLNSENIDSFHLNSENIENNYNLSNIFHNNKSASDKMEINWLKSTIDKLCQDNALLYQDINEILRIFELLGLKYKQVKDINMVQNFKNIEAEIANYKKALNYEKVHYY